MIDERHSRRGGFTLVELLVVIGIIGLMIGGLGVALKGGGSGTSSGVRGGRDLVSSMVLAARSQATMRGVDAGLVIGKDMRTCGVARRNAAGNWETAVMSAGLPKGVYVLDPGGANGSDGLVGVPTGSVLDRDGWGWVLEVGAKGRVELPGRVLVTVGRTDGTAGADTSAGNLNVQGVMVSRYGAVVFVGKQVAAEEGGGE